LSAFESRGVPQAGQSPRPNLLRELSEQAILGTIFREGPITRPEIAERTNISKPTVSSVVERLVQAGLVQPAGERPGRRGRTPIAFVVDSAAGYVVGVDIGSTRLRIAAANIYGELLHDDELETATGAKAVGEQITAEIERIERVLSPAHGGLLAIGVSTPGVVDPATRRVTSLAYHVSHSGALDSLTKLETRFRVPVLVDNDVNVAAIGEKSRGLAAGVPTFVFVTIGAGVGMGIVIDDELYRGFHGAAGEIGYLPLASDPFDEQHRRFGGLEDEIGAAGILGAFNRTAGENSALAESAREVFQRARDGDTTAREVIENEARRIGLAIATVCAVVDPGLVVLGGRIGTAPELLPPVRGTVSRLLPLPTRIEISALAERAALEGALAMGLREARERFFSRERRATA
jgi:predicted NBD/HSP70 family sugar kinase